MHAPERREHVEILENVTLRHKRTSTSAANSSRQSKAGALGHTRSVLMISLVSCLSSLFSIGVPTGEAAPLPLDFWSDAVAKNWFVTPG